MKIERKLKDIPRREIDTLEKSLDKILKPDPEGYLNISSEELIGNEWKPKSAIMLTYSQGTTREAVKLVAKGQTRNGNFEVDFNINLTDDVYTILRQNLEKQTPILAKSLPKLPSTALLKRNY